MEKIKIIDLFCGAGGKTLGFVDDRFCGNFESIFAVDSDKSAIETYNKNFKHKGILAEIEEILTSGVSIPQADVVIGGPPCQGFSLLNRNRKEDLRRALWQPYLEIVEASGALCFVMENVPALLKSIEFENITNQAQKIGFSIKSGVLTAADYGVPQLRKRAFVIGWKANKLMPPLFPPTPTHAAPEKNSTLPKWPTVKEAIGDLAPPVGTSIRDVPPPYDLQFGRNPTELSLKRYKAVPPGGNRFDLQRNAPEITPNCWLKKKSGGTDLFGRMWWDRPSPTIRTEFFKPEKGRYLHPAQDRPITHREGARLMGFPDDFVFEGSKIEIAKQIGNAVPPRLAGAVARCLFDMLKKSK
ncbi:DNA cytosine methyltransferase [Desulfobaculum sp. SPO524]|uniref:DNA cytosine methyltransferase n=1 Tax=Desulfobaculum sp. SPO524 TaxID=3378071 RepID=UPI0038541831